MSARKLFLLLSLLLMLGVLVTLPQSTQAGERGLLNAKNAALNAPPPEDEIPDLTARPPLWTEEEGKDYLLARSEYAASRRLAGDVPLTEAEAAEALFLATQRTNEMKANAREASPNAYGGAWTKLGPNPIAQISRQNNITFMAGRIGALALRSDGRMILGGATGGVWVYNAGTGDWEPKTDFLPAIAIGALGVAPSNEDIVYAGTGEGELAGDAAAGNGVLKSLDGGMSWFHVSGTYFRGVAVSNIAVDPTNPDHVYIATIRGRGGSRRTTPPPNAKYGIWESTNGGLDWTLLKGTTNQFEGATDLRMDPQDPLKLYATFWMKGIYKSADGGQTWNKIMNGLPVDADYAAGLTRFAIAVGHPVGDDPVLYAGFDYVNTSGDYFPSRVWKSVDEGANWTILPAGVVPEKVEDYCGGQCFFDNVIEVDPVNNDRVFAAGQFDYDIGSGGIFRSDDGGMTWKNLGYDQHPDFHAIAFNPANTQEIIVGSDGGVWYSADQGGRPLASDPLADVTWETLNGYTLGPVIRTELQIAQFTSIQTVRTVPGRYWGGTQDNGTMRKSTVSTTWSDVYNGDGGQVLVDPTNANFVYGHYFGITPYRATDGGAFFFNNFFIRNGLDLTDRAEFYIPATMNHGNPNQLFLGTYRVYRTDNAKTADPADVLWKPISGDLTSGCLGGAPNGARGCYVSAIAVSRGSGGAWAGSLDGYLHYAKNGATSDTPHWKRVGAGILPNRPIAGIAVDHSNSRIAYIALNGYNSATPGFPGHVFKTTSGGKNFTNITANLPNVPANWIILDPSLPDTLYVGMDTGIFVTNNGGASWDPLGTGFPIVPVWQMDLDPLNRVLVAGTHGRGAFRLTDAATLMPALVLSKTYPDVPVGPDTDVTFTLKVENIGNTAATGIEIKDKLPKDTSFVSASDGGFVEKGFIKWTGLSVPSNSSITVSLTLHINASAKKKITNKNFSVSSAEGVGARGTPKNLPLSNPNDTMVSPTSQKGAQNPSEALDYTISVRNTGYNSDSFNLSVSGNSFTTETRDASCASVITNTGTLSPGDTADVCVRVIVPAAALAGRESTRLPPSDTAKVKARSATDNSVSQTVQIQTYNVTQEILLVDEDGNIPNTQSFYTAALDTYGATYNVWDLAVDSVLPKNMLNAHPKVVWYTGNTYPGPLLIYEGQLAAYLDAGGNLFLSGQDILDQAAGTTDFIHDYVGIDWDGTEAQNDKGYEQVDGVSGSPVSNLIGNIPLDLAVLGNGFDNWITPIAPATAAFTTNDTGGEGTQITALSKVTGTFKVVFLAFGFEEYGTAGDKATVMANVLNWFDTAADQAADQGKESKKDKKDKKDKKNKQGGSSGGGN